MGKRLLVCLAFATWCFLNTWVELAQGETSYLARFDPRITVALPVVVCELVLALLMLGLWEFCRRYVHTRVPPLLFLTSCLLPLGIGSVALLRISPINLVPVVRNPLFWPVALIAAPAPVIFALRRPRSAARTMCDVFLYSWPVLAVILVLAVRAGLWHSGAEFDDGRLAAKVGAIPRVRVVWVVFDELSGKIVFGDRPAGLKLPNCDRLRAESFYATAANPPGDATQLCMPSLILGQTVTEAIPIGPAEARMKTQRHTESFGWNAYPNVFDRARAMGYNTALVGWFHPYGRLLNRSLTDSSWVAGWLNSGVEEPSDRQCLMANVWFRIRTQFAALPLLGHLPGIFPGVWQRLEMTKRFEYQLARAEQVAGDASVGLTLIHLQVPHPPSLYSRRQGVMAPWGKNSYVDSIALADQTLGVLRQTMEQGGVWQKTAVVVTADHGWRSYLWRGTPEWTAEDESLSREGTLDVPFLVKMPNRTSSLRYTRPFNTVVTSSVIINILAGKVTEAAQLPEVIDKENAAAHESDY